MEVIPLVETAVQPGPIPTSLGSTSPGEHMDASTTVTKRNRTPSPGIQGCVGINICLKIHRANLNHHWRWAGIKFEVANLDHQEQAPESVTRLGKWPVKCWVATDNDPTYDW
ncbi:hypothetical protein E2C01_028216 [Portunus trituberculatus]|uniref:Uncharacterized protein n=1 Tax=Portunus trituberculatus TaxID=210409 RepID=A0A5B7ER11_PORTR|nr:hypothetical protein [Portunus trituberculatus]